jgi:hypothetical protein
MIKSEQLLPSYIQQSAYLGDSVFDLLLSLWGGRDALARSRELACLKREVSLTIAHHSILLYGTEQCIVLSRQPIS